MSQDLAMRELRHVTFRGNVQGVGFRWTTRQTAHAYDVNGWVRNCSDGSVELEAEGESGEIDQFLEDLRRRMGRHIRKETSDSRSPKGMESGFRIIH
jgi:acylphosphatase